MKTLSGVVTFWARTRSFCFAKLICGIATLLPLADTSNAFGEMMFTKRLGNTSGSESGSSAGSHRSQQVHDASFVSSANVFHEESALFAPHYTSPVSQNDALSSHRNQHVLFDWKAKTNFELKLPHFSDSFHAYNHVEIVKDLDDFEFKWDHHFSTELKINTPWFHEDFQFSDCFQIDLHWEPGQGFGFSEHLEIDRHFHLEICHLTFDRNFECHKDFSCGSGHHNGCHQPPPPCAVPEPTSMALLGLGGIGAITGLSRRRRK